MDIVQERAAGLDDSKRDAKLCLRVPGLRAGTYSSTVTTWGATMAQILELGEFLEREHVTTVVMEATSDYRKPFFYLLEETLLCPGRDAAGDAGQRQGRKEHPWPQNRCLRRGLAGPARRARAAPGVVCPAGTDP
jgi:hypothetical protein